MANKSKVEIQILATDKNVKKVTEETAKGFRKMRQGADHASKGFLGIRRHAESLRRGLFSLKGMLGGLVAGFAAYKALGVAKSFLEVASSVENYRIRLITLLGSQQAANEAMKFFNEIAGKTPATLGEVIDAGVTLTAMGADYKKWIPVLNDLSVIMGMKMPAAAEALGRAYAGGVAAADMFRDRGIRQIIEDFAKLKYGIDDITKVEIPKFREIMYEAFVEQGGKIAGAGDAMAKGWTGMISMVADAWFRFRQKVMDTDVFLTLKTSLQKFLDLLGVWKEEGKIDEWAEKTAKGAIDAFEQIALGAGRVVDVFHGWKMIILGVKEAILTMRHVMAEAWVEATRVSGTQEDYEKAKEGADRLLGKLFETNAELKSMVAGETAVSKVKDAFIALRKEVEETKKEQAEQAQETEKTADAAEEGSKMFLEWSDGAKKTAGNFSKIRTTSEEVTRAVGEGAKKVEEENELYKKQIALLEKKILLLEQMAKEPGVKSFTPEGMRLGGPVPPMQGGGAIPGWGGGDKHIRALEGGEEVLDKYSARLGRQSGILAALREMARGGGMGQERGFFRVDFGFPTANIPNVQITADEAGAAFMEYIKHGKMTKGNF